MRTNISNWDAAIRIVLGISLLGVGGFGIVAGIGLRIICMLVAVEPLITGLSGYSPLYNALHIHTSRT